MPENTQGWGTGEIFFAFLESVSETVVNPSVVSGDGTVGCNTIHTTAYYVYFGFDDKVSSNVVISGDVGIEIGPGKLKICEGEYDAPP